MPGVILTFQPKGRYEKVRLFCESNRVEDRMGRVGVDRLGGKLTEACESVKKPRRGIDMQ